jgi:hypothetical protein
MKFTWWSNFANIFFIEQLLSCKLSVIHEISSSSHILKNFNLRGLVSADYNEKAQKMEFMVI